MKPSQTISRNTTLEPGLREIRAHWTAEERQRREERGRRRAREFMLLFDNPESDAELWACGAPNLDDLRRLQAD